jgi:hypothetical protein
MLILKTKQPTNRDLTNAKTELIIAKQQLKDAENDYEKSRDSINLVNDYLILQNDSLLSTPRPTEIIYKTIKIKTNEKIKATTNVYSSVISDSIESLYKSRNIKR